MTFRSPAEYYIKYLVSHPDGYSNEDIVAALAEKGLLYRAEAYLTRVRTQTVPPIPFWPYNKEHFASQHFLNKHRLYSLYFPDSATKEALAILDNAVAREFVESMLLVRAVPEIIARNTVRVGADIKVTADGVSRYKHYFWNINLLGFTEMRALLEEVGQAGGSAYSRAFRRDSRKLAAELPFNPVSAMISQTRMGITPQGFEHYEVMSKVVQLCGLKAYQYVLDDSPYSSEIAFNYIRIAQAATDMLERAARPEEKLLERFKTLQLELDETPIPHIRQLSEGQHTTDFQAHPANMDVVNLEVERES